MDAPQLITTQIRKAIECTYPLRGVQIQVSPQVDLTLGDYFSAVCFEVARLERALPHRIAERLLSAIEPDKRLSYSHSRGYINITVRDLNLWRVHAKSAMHCPQSFAHLVLVIESGLRPFGIDFLRLAARAMVQTRLLRAHGCKADFSILDANGVWLYSLEEAQPRIVGAACSPNVVKQESRQRILALIEHEIFGRFQGHVHLWVLPELLEDRVFVSCLREWQSRKAGPFSTRSVDRGKHASTHAVDYERCRSFSAEELHNLFLNMCGDEEPHELDIESARLPERANILWYLRQTVRRLERLGLANEASASDFGRQRLIYQRVACWGLFVAEAAYYGKIVELWQALRSLLDAVNATLNDPATYLQLGSSKERVGDNSGLPFSSVHDCFSGMLEGISRA